MAVPEPDESVEAMHAHDEAKQPEVEPEPQGGGDWPEQAAPDERPKPPPRAGPGSSIDAWRDYAIRVSESPGSLWGFLSRAEIIATLEREGVLG